MTRFIEDQRSVFGVGPICRVLPIAPATYYARAAVMRDPGLASERAKSDVIDCEDIGRIYKASGQRYGTRKVWHALRREGKDIARCTVERLMKALEIQGVVRGAKVITTNPDTAQPCPDDKVNREFAAQMPNQLWVSDFTYVSSWQGMVYVAFVIDVFARKIVGWRVSTSMTTSFVLDALNQAICQRCPSEADNLIHHSDRGSQDGFKRLSQRFGSYLMLRFCPILGRPAQGNGHIQRPDCKVTFHSVRHGPTDDPPGMQVQHYSQIGPALTGPDITDIHHPFLVWLFGKKVSVQQVRCNVELVIAVRRDLVFTGSDNRYAVLAE